MRDRAAPVPRALPPVLAGARRAGVRLAGVALFADVVFLAGAAFAGEAFFAVLFLGVGSPAVRFAAALLAVVPPPPVFFAGDRSAGVLLAVALFAGPAFDAVFPAVVFLAVVFTAPVFLAGARSVAAFLASDPLSGGSAAASVVVRRAVALLAAEVFAAGVAGVFRRPGDTAAGFAASVVLARAVRRADADREEDPSAPGAPVRRDSPPGRAPSGAAASLASSASRDRDWVSHATAAPVTATGHSTIPAMPKAPAPV